MTDTLALLNKFYPQFDEALKNTIAQNASIKHFKSGEEMMRSGQYLKSTMLITKGMVKLFTNGEDGGEFF
ncbi:MAG: Crp/Fnr family transcriptional regulator, partial [Bacteroidia bacterium]|nr:Crp/Fnr family transcriptional regulator [Bacteroidia bacterium]